MSTWKEHCGFDAEFNDLWIRTDGTRWQRRHEMPFTENMSGADLVKQIQSLSLAYHDVEVGVDYQYAEPYSIAVPRLLYWEDMAADHPDVVFAQEDLGARMDRKERYHFAQLMKDPEFARAFKERVEKLFRDLNMRVDDIARKAGL